MNCTRELFLHRDTYLIEMGGVLHLSFSYIISLPHHAYVGTYATPTKGDNEHLCPREIYLVTLANRYCASSSTRRF
jgi:hypothetical protein